MINNDVLRSLRYMFDLPNGKVVDIIQAVDPAFAVDEAEVNDWLRDEENPLFVPCPDAALVRLLDGLILLRRGPSPDGKRRPFEKRSSNNLVLKKLRVAFNLKDEDMHAIFEDVGLPLSKPELSALFRDPSHKNYREAGDQVLRNFLKGLTLRLRD